MTILKCIDNLSEWSGRCCRWLIIPLMGITVYDVILRYIFRDATAWAYETKMMLYGALFMLGGAYTLLHNAHVRIDIFYSRLVPQHRAIVEIVFYLVFFLPLMAVLTKYGIDYAWHSWAIKETSAVSYWYPPIYPLKTVLPLAFFLLGLQGVAELARSVTIAVKGEP